MLCVSKIRMKHKTLNLRYIYMIVYQNIHLDLLNMIKIITSQFTDDWLYRPLLEQLLLRLRVFRCRLSGISAIQHDSRSRKENDYRDNRKPMEKISHFPSIRPICINKCEKNSVKMEFHILERLCTKCNCTRKSEQEKAYFDFRGNILGSDLNIFFFKSKYTFLCST